MEETYDLTAARRARRAWLALALASAVVLFALDAVTDQRANLIGLFAVPPFVAAFGAGRRETAGVAVLVVAMALISGALDDFFGSFDHLIKVLLVAAASGFAIRVAEVRERAEVASRLEGVRRTDTRRDPRALPMRHPGPGGHRAHSRMGRRVPVGGARR